MCEVVISRAVERVFTNAVQEICSPQGPRLHGPDDGPRVRVSGDQCVADVRGEAACHAVAAISLLQGTIVKYMGIC